MTTLIKLLFSYLSHSLLNTYTKNTLYMYNEYDVVIVQKNCSVLKKR